MRPHSHSILFYIILLIIFIFIANIGEVNSQDQLELRSIVQATMNASSSKGNPITLSLEHLTEILLRAL